MFEASSVYFQCVNECAAHVKIDRVSCWCRPWQSKSLTSSVVGCLRLQGFYEKSKGFGTITMIF